MFQRSHLLFMGICLDIAVQRILLNHLLLLGKENISNAVDLKYSLKLI